MPRHPEPWYREGRGWYVQFDGRQTFLGEHPPDLPTPQKDENGRWHPPRPIRGAFHRRMAGRAGGVRTPILTGNLTAAEVLDEFIGWLKARVSEGSKAQRTLTWYEDYLTSFLRFLRTLEATPEPKGPPQLTVDELGPMHVYR